MFQQFLNVGYQWLKAKAGNGYRCNLSGYSRIKTNHQKIKLISYALYGEYMLILCSRCSHYSSARRNPLNTKSCSLPGWGIWAATGSKRRKRDRARWQDKENFSWLKCLETPRQLPLFTSIPGHLKNPANKRLGIPGCCVMPKRSITNSSVSTASLFLVTKNIQSNSEQQTLLKSTQVLTKSTFTSTIVTLVTFS